MINEGLESWDAPRGFDIVLLKGGNYVENVDQEVSALTRSEFGRPRLRNRDMRESH